MQLGCEQTLSMHPAAVPEQRRPALPLPACAGAAARSQQEAQAHSNCIVSITSFRDASGPVAGMFTTAGLDGRVVLWMLPQEQQQQQQQ